MVHHRLICRIFMHNYSVGKEPDYLQINDFLKDSYFTFFIQKVYKKEFANLSTSYHIEDIEEVTAKTILIF